MLSDEYIVEDEDDSLPEGEKDMVTESEIFVGAYQNTAILY